MIQILCVPPDLCKPVLAKCKATILRGLDVAEMDEAELIERLSNKTALLWLIMRDDDVLALGFTERIPEDDAVAVFGLAGRDMWRWAKLFADRITDYAAAEGCERVLFAGSKAWGRIIPHAAHIGTTRGQEIFERRTLQ
ncbi:MAG: hypothetical protein AB7U76_25055 [Pirellulales bacterium]